MSFGGARRRKLLTVMLAAGLVCVLGGCSGERTGGLPARREVGQLGRAIAVAPASTSPSAPAEVKASSDAVQREGRCGGWTHDPDDPLPACSPILPLLAVARRFADAYVRYQTGELTPEVRRELDATCTAAFARFLVSQPVRVPPGQHLAPEHVTSVIFAAGRKANASWVATRAPAGQPRSGAVQITLTLRRGRWLVTGARALL
jgi:hypothetical protein